MTNSTIFKTEYKDLLYSDLTITSLGAVSLVSDVDLTKYSEIEVWYCPHGGESASLCSRMPAPSGASYSKTLRLLCNKTESLSYRNITVTSTEVRCGSGYVFGTYFNWDSRQVSGDACVPVKIYGIL